MNKPTQKYHRGDVVRIAKTTAKTRYDLPIPFRGQEAIVIYSYMERNGGTGSKDYALLIITTGEESCWYREEHLTFIRAGGEGEIYAVINTRKAEIVKQTSLSWIVENWEEIRSKPPGATIAELLRLCGMIDPLTSFQGKRLGDYSDRGDSVVPLLDKVLSTGSLAQVRRQACRLRTQAAQRFASDRVVLETTRLRAPARRFGVEHNHDWVAAHEDPTPYVSVIPRDPDLEAMAAATTLPQPY